MSTNPPGPIPAGEGDEDAPGTASSSSDPSDQEPLRDPAHRAARWFMLLAPLLLGVLVFLLLRLSTD